MTKKESLQLFEEKKVRTVWDDKEEKWYFSIVDVCGVLTEQQRCQCLLEKAEAETQERR